jgi:deoxyribodipyrimidine photo-lyase
MEKNKAVFWFRNDLRLKEHPAIQKAMADNYQLVFVYCFEQSLFENFKHSDIIRMDSFRYAFIKQSLLNLKNNLEKIGGELHVFYGDIIEEISKFCSQNGIKKVFASKEVADEELITEQSLIEKNNHIDFEFVNSNYLINAENLKFDIFKSLSSFSSFRNKIEKYLAISITEERTIECFKLNIENGLKDAEDLYGCKKMKGENSFFEGGEDVAWKRLNYYFSETGLVKTYKETRNGMLGTDFSSHFSAWLSAGCISPVSIYVELKEFENTVIKNESTYWLFFELLWREYFRLLIEKEPVAYFQLKGIQKEKPYKYWFKEELWGKWKNGKTGVPLVDANMKELNTTGFMSNRGRQIVASFLINDYHLDWRLGAEYFQSLLIDYDVQNNWGNWAYLAGVGNDPRGNRYFNLEFQGKRYDADAKYIKHFLPEFTEMTADEILSIYIK